MRYFLITWLSVKNKFNFKAVLRRIESFTVGCVSYRVSFKVLDGLLTLTHLTLATTIRQVGREIQA